MTVQTLGRPLLLDTQQVRLPMGYERFLDDGHDESGGKFTTANHDSFPFSPFAPFDMKLAINEFMIEQLS